MMLSVLSVLMNNVVVPMLLSLLLGVVALLLAKLQAHMHVSDEALKNAKDSAANVALTNAIVTFAGLTLADIKSGKLTLADVKDGEVAAKMVGYLNTTVAGAMVHFNKPPEDLTQMLVGKIAAIDPGVAAGVPTMFPAPGVPDVAVPSASS